MNNKKFVVGKQYHDGTTDEPQIHKIDEIDFSWRMKRRDFIATTALGLSAIKLFSADLFSAGSSGKEKADRSMEIIHASGESISDMEFSPDNTLIAVRCETGDYPIRVWDTTSGKLVLAVKKDPASRIWPNFGKLRFSPDNKFFGCTMNAVFNDIASIWKLPDTKPVIVTGDKNDGIQHLVFSPDNIYAAVLTKSCKIRLIHLPGCSVIDEIECVSKKVSKLEFSPDGKYLAAFDIDGNIDILNLMVKPFQTENISGFTAGLYCAYTNDGEGILITKNNKLAVWDLKNRSVRGYFRNTVYGTGMYRLTPDNKFIVILDYTTKSVSISSTADFSVKTDIPFKDNVFPLTISPDSRFLFFTKDEKTIAIYNIETGKLIKSLPVISRLQELICSNSGKYLLAAGLEEAKLGDYRNPYSITQWSIPDWKQNLNMSGVKLFKYGGIKNILTSIEDHTRRNISVYELPVREQKVSFFDPSALYNKHSARQYTSKNKKGNEIYSAVPEGFKLPAGAVCTCNIVQGTFEPSYEKAGNFGGGGGGGKSFCTCDQICTCVPVK